MRVSSSMALIANLALKIGMSFRNRSRNLANTFLEMARKDNAKLKIILKENEIDYKFETPSNDPKNNWENYYANCGLFLDGRAQEIRLDHDEIRKGKFELTEKAKLEPVFEANLARNLWGFAIDNSTQERINYIMIGGIAILIFLMVT